MARGCRRCGPHPTQPSSWWRPSVNSTDGQQRPTFIHISWWASSARSSAPARRTTVSQGMSPLHHRICSDLIPSPTWATPPAFTPPLRPRIPGREPHRSPAPWPLHAFRRARRRPPGRADRAGTGPTRPADLFESAASALLPLPSSAPRFPSPTPPPSRPPLPLHTMRKAVLPNHRLTQSPGSDISRRRRPTGRSAACW